MNSEIRYDKDTCDYEEYETRSTLSGAPPFLIQSHISLNLTETKYSELILVEVLNVTKTKSSELQMV